MKEYMKSITFYTYDFEKKYTAGWKDTLLLGDMSYGSTIRPATGQIIQDNKSYKIRIWKNECIHANSYIFNTSNYRYIWLTNYQ